MYNTSSEYKTEIKKPSRSFECKITIGDRMFYNEDIVNVIIDGNIQPQDGFMIGSTTSQTLDLTLLNKGDSIYSTNQIKLEIGLKIGTTIEYILMGYYNIDDVEKTDYTIKFAAFDNMIKFETPYFSSLGDTPTLTQVVNELASKTGVQFVGSLPSYTVKKLEGFTCREILSYAASVCGGNAVITRDGKFTIVYPKDINYSIDANNYIDLKREEVKYKIGKVSCQVKEKEIISKGSLGTDSMELLFENPWVSETILTDIYNRLNGFEYLGYSLKWQGDLSLDVGDIITCIDVKGVVRKLPILSQKFTYTGGLTSEVAAKGETKNKNSFSSSGSMGNKVNRVVTEVALINKAFIDYAHINDADIVNLKAETAKIHDLEVETANINNLLAGNIGAGSTQTIHLTAKNVTMDDAFIKELIASRISVSDLLASDISTNNFRIVSDNGGIEIVGATQQFKDKNNKVRIQMGQDTQGNFNFILRGEDGTTTLIDHTGIKEKAIANDLIKENMVAANAIGEKQINYSSLITGLNKDTNTQLIKASKVALDTTGQSLEISFNSLKSNVDNIEVVGRNLLKGTSSAFTSRIMTEWNSLYYTYTIEELGLNVGDKISFGLYLKFGETLCGGSARITFFDSSNVNIKNEIDKKIIKSNEEGYSYITTTVPENAVLISIGVQREIPGEGLAKFNFSAKKEKLEKGTKVTDWTPAPEDIDKKIESNTTSIKAINGQIDTLVKDTTITDNGTSVKLQDFYSTFKQTSKDISLKVESLETMKIGGRNLIGNSAPTTLDGWNSAGVSHTKELIDDAVSPSGKVIKVTFTATGSSGGTHKPPFKRLEVGKEYTWSVWIKGNNSKQISVGHEQGGRKAITLVANIWTKYSNTFVATDTVNQSFVFYLNSPAIGDAYFVHSLLLQEGNKIITDWIPAIEDTDSKVNDLSSRIETAEINLKPGTITQSISEAINGGTASISTVATILDKNGFTVKNGAISILNNAGQKVFYGEANGDLTLAGKLKTGNAVLTSNDLTFSNGAGKTLSMKNGKLNIFKYSKEWNNIYLGSLTASQINNYYGMQIMGGSPCYYADFGYDYSVHTEDDGFSASSLLRLVFTDFPNNKKGVHIYNAPLVMHNHINLENNVLYTDSKRNDSVFSTDKGTYIGSEKMISFGVVNPNGELYHNTYLTLNNRAIANSVGLDAYCWLDMHKNEIWNTTLRNSYSSAAPMALRSSFAAPTFTTKNVYKETTAIEGYKDQIRIPITANTVDGSCRINIPPVFLSILESFIIVGLTKYGKGDIWIAEEFEDYFIVNSDVDMKFSLDMVIFKNTI
jgi:Carbohydrate binding domain